MITIGNMHQRYIFRVWSVVLPVLQCYRFCRCLLLFCCCLLYFIYLLEGEGAGGGSMCILYFVAAVALCVRVKGGGGLT